MKTDCWFLRKSIGHSFLQRALLIVVLLVCFLLSPIAQATKPSPTPTPTPAGENRGNGNTAAENVQALNSNTTGINNTATG